MSQQHTRQATISLALIGCLCCLAAGCGQAPGDEYRTYAETISEAPSPLEPVAAESVTIPPPVTEPLPERLNVEANATTLEGPSAPLAEPKTSDALADRDTFPMEGQAIVPLDLAGAKTALLTSRQIRLLVTENHFQTVGPEGAVRVSYDDIDLLKVLNMDPVPKLAPDYFPDWLNGLMGQRIRIRGFMYPPDFETGIRSFVLARDNQICCFGRNPMPYDIVPVVLRGDVRTDYINGRPFDVVGVLNIFVDTVSPTKVHTVYYIDDAIVID